VLASRSVARNGRQLTEDEASGLAAAHPDAVAAQSRNRHPLAIGRSAYAAKIRDGGFPLVLSVGDVDL
jgi:hypothetical protein